MIRRFAQLALSCAWAATSLAQTPASSPAPPHPESTVHASATVEVIEDPSQVDDVIARMKRPEVRSGKLPPTTSTVPVDGLQVDRPQLPDEGRMDRDTERPLTKAERRALEIERRRRLRQQLR